MAINLLKINNQHSIMTSLCVFTWSDDAEIQYGSILTSLIHTPGTGENIVQFTIYTYMQFKYLKSKAIFFCLSTAGFYNFHLLSRLLEPVPMVESERQEYSLDRSRFHPHAYSLGKLRVSSQLTLTRKVEA